MLICTYVQVYVCAFVCLSSCKCVLSVTVLNPGLTSSRVLKKVAPVIQAEVHAPDPLSFITASTVLLSFFWIRFVNMTGSEI